MSVTLIRFKGGAGGDTILKLIQLSNPHAKFNVSFPGKAGLCTTTDTNFEHGNVIGKLGNTYNGPLTDAEGELDRLPEENEYYLKSHNYDVNYKDCTIDITCDNLMLPFLVNAFLTKTNYIDSQEHVLLRKIKDVTLKTKYIAYAVALDVIKTRHLAGTKVLPVTTILGGWDKLSSAMRELGIALNEKSKEYYDIWLSHNIALLPSKEYQKCVETKDYSNTNVSLTEKYCLLALSGEKFKV